MKLSARVKSSQLSTQFIAHGAYEVHAALVDLRSTPTGLGARAPTEGFGDPEILEVRAAANDPAATQVLSLETNLFRAFYATPLRKVRVVVVDVARTSRLVGIGNIAELKRAMEDPVAVFEL
ncbi:MULTISPECIES: hypothetical protein [unclassified Microbacterium]|uniref:hypothetical protein n=1 Tax=unclassified Microbacterium TaxID=2609290 RepID=UPI00300F8B63